MNTTRDADVPGERRQRKRTKSAHSGSDKVTAKCPLGSLPVELLDMILSHTTPRDILALARTDKFFCATLVNPSHTVIWKQARLRFVPPIPEPTPNFTESAYAAFLFDHGVCEHCGKKVKTMYASFSIRLRLCDKDTCRKRWKETKAMNLDLSGIASSHKRYRSIVDWIPSLEYTSLGYNSDYQHDTANILVRTKDFQAAINEFHKATLDETTKQRYTEAKNALVSCVQGWKKLCRELVSWRNLCIRNDQLIQEENFSAKRTAISEGWTLWDMLQSRTFGSLYRNKNTSWRLLDNNDITPIRAELEAELLHMQEAVKRRKDEKEYSKRRKDVETFYHNLRKDGDAGVLPPLPEFRKLPMVKRMQYKIGQEPSKGVAQELRSSNLIRELVREDLARWRDEAKAALCEVLGVKSWKSASKNKLHPVDRLTARFRCKRCDAKQGRRHWENSSFDLAGACGHICTRDNGKLAKDDWAADRFVPDTTAIDVVGQVLRQCGCDADDVKSIQLVEKLGSRIICKSCPSSLRMDFRTLLRHCYRHETPAIEVLPKNQMNTMVPIEYGLYAKLITKESEPARRQRIYQCRHCVAARVSPADDPCQLRADTNQADPGATTHEADVEQVEHVAEPATAGQAAAPQPVAAKKGRQKQQHKAFTFDGLRSHAKEKHGIEWIGDEDFYREPEPAATAAASASA